MHSLTHTTTYHPSASMKCFCSHNFISLFQHLIFHFSSVQCLRLSLTSEFLLVELRQVFLISVFLCSFFTRLFSCCPLFSFLILSVFCFLSLVLFLKYPLHTKNLNNYFSLWNITFCPFYLIEDLSQWIWIQILFRKTSGYPK